MANQIGISAFRALDANGDPVPGAKASFFQTGTSTPLTVYSDTALSSAHPSPLVADGSGVFAQAFHDGAVAVKVTVDTAADVNLYTLDPAPESLISATGAGSVSFTPTADIPDTDVQNAIEQVQANIGTALTGIGLNLTATAPEIPDFDASTTASGAYQYLSTSTNIASIPTQLQSANGYVLVWRHNAGQLTQMIWRNNMSGGIWWRSYVSGAWSAAQQVMSIPAPVAGDTIYSDGTDTQALNIGTAGQVLTVNSGASAPEWADNVSGMNTFSTATPSAAAQQDFTFQTGFRTQIFTGHLLPATDNVELNLLLATGGTFNTTGYYMHRSKRTDVSTGVGTDSDSRVPVGGGANCGNVSGEGMRFRIEITNSEETGETWGRIEAQVRKPAGSMEWTSTDFMANTAEANDKLRLSFSSGNIASGYVVHRGVA